MLKSWVISVLEVSQRTEDLCLAYGCAHLRAGLEAAEEERLKITHQPCCKNLGNVGSNLSMLLVLSVSQCTPVARQDFVLNGIKVCKDTNIQQAHSIHHCLKAHPEQVLLQIT